MPVRTAKSGSELFIVDNSDTEWKVAKYLHDWCQISSAIDIATAYFEIGSLLALDNEWQKVDQLRILMGDEISKRTKTAFVQGLSQIRQRLRQDGTTLAIPRSDRSPFFPAHDRVATADQAMRRKRQVSS